MPEIKHTFTGGKMNKDLDERLVPNGEYRNASNIQVRTTDGDAAGTVQGIKGNTSIGSFTNTTNPHTGETTKTIGSITDEKNDNIYFFMAAPTVGTISLETMNSGGIDADGTVIFTDAIVQQNVDGTITPVIIDEHTIITKSTTAFTDEDSFNGYDPQDDNWYEIKITDTTIAEKVRVGMKIEIFDEEGNNKIPNAIIKNIFTKDDGFNYLTLHTGYPGSAISDILLAGASATTDPNDSWVKFSSPKVLNFNYEKQVTAISVIDNLLIWTDGSSEPKKINIDRCIAGTPAFVPEEYVYNGDFSENLTANSDNDPLDGWATTGGVTFGGSSNAPSVNNANATAYSLFPESPSLSLNNLQGSDTSLDTSEDTGDPTAANNGVITQSITGLTIGQTYVYSFDYIVIVGTLTSDLDGSVDESETFAAPNPATTEGTSGTYTHTFVAATDQLDISFYGTQTTPAIGGIVFAIIDNVSLLSSSATTYSHTQLYVQDPTDISSEAFIPVTELEHYNFQGDEIDSSLKEEHITVIKKAPRCAPTLILSSSDSRGFGLTGFDLTNSPFITGDGGEDTLDLSINDTRVFSSTILPYTDLRLNDVLDFTNDYVEYDSTGTQVVSTSFIKVTCKFISYLDTDTNENTNESTSLIKVEVLGFDGDILGSNVTSWNVKLRQKAPLFELKLGRFACRYKYEDGEYSSFSPWSELAFLPGNFDYEAERGHNLGMKNNVRKIVIKDFIPFGNRPLDVSSVDILYKPTDEPNCYVVKTISRGVDAEWELFTPSGPGATGTSQSDDQKELTGQLTITSEAIHRILPESQILRTWDNVPRYAYAQEITGNRLLFGNYVQGYDIQLPVGLTQEIIGENIQDIKSPNKSIKSIRDYKWGMVFGDKYGRETPVITSGYTTGYTGNYTSLTGDVSLEKSFSNTKNLFRIKQNWSNPTNTNNTPPSWAEYVKYYVKETSNEYYNLVLNRWYYADEKGSTVWLSFQSTDRNKVDEETYLILKSKNGSAEQVENEGRYRIIAIENNAPDFIKTKHNKIGSITALPGDSQTGLSVWATANATVTDVSPINLTDPDFERLEIDTSVWDQLFGMGTAGGVDDKPKAERSKISMRVKGEDTTGIEKYSKWNEVTNYKSDSSGGTFHIYFADNFGADADMYARFIADSTLEYPADGTDTVTGLTYTFEFKEEIIENKPEFDGRFFVKVEADTTLEDNVLLTSEIDEVFTNIASTKISYIESKSTNSAQSGDHAGETWDFGEGNGWWYNEFDNVNNSGWTSLSAGGTNPAWYSNTQDPYPPYVSAIAGGVVYNGPITLGWANSTSGTNAMFFSRHSRNETGGFDNNARLSCPGANTYVTLSGTFNISGGNSNLESGFAFYCWKYSTYRFWYERTQNLPGRPFIDAAKPAGVRTGAMTSWNLYTNLYNEYPQYPRGLEVGSISSTASYANGFGGATTPINGTLGKMALSVLGFTEYDNIQPQESQFFMLEMRKPGTFFRFTGDSENVYKVIETQDYPSTGLSNGMTFVSTTTAIPPGKIKASTNTGANARVGFVLNFRKYDPASNQLLNEGIDVSSWDPRGVSRHDGRDGLNTSGGADATHQLEIEIVRKQTFGGVQLIFDSDPAILETEPKKDVDLDIYYEGSNSIPLVLNENNIYDFAPIDSMVSIQRVNSLTVDDVELPSTAETNSIQTPSNKVGDAIGRPSLFNIDFDPSDAVLANGDEILGFGDPIIEVINKSLPDSAPYYLQKNGIYINDEIIFNHKNGTKTRSKVTGFFDKNKEGEDDGLLSITNSNYSPVFTTAGKIQAKPTFSFNEATSGANDWDPSVGELVNELEIANGDISLLSEGMQLVGDGVDPGVIIVQIVSTSPARIKVSSSIGTPFYFKTSAGALQTAEEFETANVDGELFDVEFVGPPTGYYSIDRNAWKYPVDLSWFNCYSYGNGVESDRIRDDFNAPQIGNGVRVSTTFSGYGQEDKTSGLIYSGLYNSTSEVNNLNEFNMSQKITKDLNPSYGSIQRLKTRDTDVIVLTEDKVLKVLSSKDALFNADGNPQLTATDRVLGTAIPFVGDYGISKNPESLAFDQYRMYFTDKQRGAVLRLSQDGLTPISNVGMKSYFRDNLKLTDKALGTFDVVSGEYNLTLTKTNPDSTYDTTISFSEESKGWVSFKTFIPEAGGSVSGSYITAKGNSVYQHYTNSLYNSFYGVDPTTDSSYESSVSVLFNDIPGVIKSFNSVNYEGSQSRVVKNTSDTNEFYNLEDKKGWYVNSFETDKHSGTVPEFIEKEGKWYNKINGVATTLTNLDTGEFTVQGIGNASIISSVYL